MESDARDPVGNEHESVFSRAIQEHLELKAQNAELDGTMPLERYAPEDPFENHPLFKSEEQARWEDTLEGDETAPTVTRPEPLRWPGEGEEAVEGAALDAALWGRSRDFDWGD